MKPDVVAPGAFVVGAMSAQADPKDNPNSVFAGSRLCAEVDEDCTVVDDQHAVLTGTSMASPIVTGAVALLLEQNPDRTQDEILTLLQAGARFPKGLVRAGTQLGAGALDLGGILDVEHSMTTPAGRQPSPDMSWLNLGATYAHPDASWAIPAVLQLRDESGLVADASENELAVTVDRGAVTERVERAAPGFYRFAVAAGDGTGGDTLNIAVVHRGITLLSQNVPIAVDVNVAREGFSARGGCTMTRASLPPAASLAVGVLVFTAWRGRRRKSAARRVRSRGRTDRWARCRQGSFQK